MQHALIPFVCTFFFNFHLHVTEVINQLHFDLCYLRMSAFLIVGNISARSLAVH